MYDWFSHMVLLALPWLGMLGLFWFGWTCRGWRDRRYGVLSDIDYDHEEENDRLNRLF